MTVESIEISGNNENERKQIKRVNELEGRCAYFPLADYHNIRIFERYSNSGTIKKNISCRLYMALLLFDKVILHCSDPLRSEIIYDLLSEDKKLQFIENEDLLFVFSNSINDIEKDFKEYIIQKMRDYELNKFSKTDISSLAQVHMDDGFYKKVIEILNKTPCLLKTGITGSKRFKTLIKSDLSDKELPVMGKDTFANSHIRLLNLTLYQLLNLRYISNEKKENKEVLESVFEEEKIKEFIDSWISESETRPTVSFSRHTIVEQLSKECVVMQKGITQNRQKSVINAIETRLSLLYSKLNCGIHQIIEFHPATEKKGVYNWSCFEGYMGEIVGNIHVALNGEKVRAIRESGEWDEFRNGFLICMAELNGQAAVSQRPDGESLEPDHEVFLTIMKKHKISSKYSEIKKILIN